MAEALRGEGVEVELLAEHFTESIADEEWLRVAGERGWIVLTKDKHIRRRTLELAALLHGQTRSFALTGGEMRGHAMAEAFRRALPRMKQFVRDFPAPFVATVSAAGRVTMLLRHAAIRKAIARAAERKPEK